MPTEEFHLNDDISALDEQTGLGGETGTWNPRAGRKGKGSAFLKSNMWLIVMFVAGLVGIYALSLRHGPAQASAQQRTAELVVNDALSHFAKGSRDKTAKAMAVVNTFYLRARQRQIPPDLLAGNPFVYHSPAATMSVVKVETAASADEAELLARAMANVQSLVLQSVLSGSTHATAMISNNLLTAGQKIRGWTVTKITPDQVVLTWKDHSYVLRMAK